MKLITHLKRSLSLLMMATTALSFSAIEAEDTDREAIRAEMIASNPLHEQQVSMDLLLLPRNLYLLQGKNGASSRLTLYYRNLVLSPFTNVTVNAACSNGNALQGRWFYESSAATQLTDAVPFNLGFSLTTPASQSQAATSVEVVSETNTSPARLLALGDSLTRMGNYLYEVENSLTNVETVGTITYPNETIAREGRGGWTFKKYFTNIGLSDTLDSPFLFPVGVSGSQYKGNTADWKRICTSDPFDSAYGGLKKMARGWKDSGDYLYDQDGYYKYPAVGDVMVNPYLPLGSRWVQWDGTAWTPMATQPTEFELSYAKYLERFAAAFPEGTPTHISILLGANDFGTFDTLMDMDGYLSYMQAFIDSVHQYDPSVKIIICTPTLGPNQSIITEDNAMYYRYDRNIKLAAHYILDTYDNDASTAQNIFIAPLTLTLDTANGYDYEKTQVMENGLLTTKVKAKNTLHPNAYGHQLMGSTLAAVLQKTRNIS